MRGLPKCAAEMGGAADDDVEIISCYESRWEESWHTRHDSSAGIFDYVELVIEFCPIAEELVRYLRTRCSASVNGSVCPMDWISNLLKAWRISSSISIGFEAISFLDSMSLMPVAICFAASS